MDFLPKFILTLLVVLYVSLLLSNWVLDKMPFPSAAKIAARDTGKLVVFVVVLAAAFIGTWALLGSIP